MKWIKANERLPEIGWTGFFKYTDDDGRFNKAGKFIGSHFVGQGNYDVKLSRFIEWLDESESQPSSDQIAGEQNEEVFSEMIMDVWSGMSPENLISKYHITRK